MIEGGYYIKARSIQSSLIAVQPPYVRETWDYLLREANHTSVKYAGFQVNRGQLFRSYNEIREAMHWMVGWRKETYNENQTKKAMKFLREALMITTKKELGGVLITICNYDLYQDPKNYERTTNDTNERTIAKPNSNQPLPDNNKNERIKEEEELINNNTLLSQASPDDLPDENSKLYFTIAKGFYDQIEKNLTELKVNSNHLKKAKYLTWTEPVRLLVIQDKYTIEEIRDVLRFLKDEPFNEKFMWRTEIRSTSKLREKFETLLIKSKINGKHKIDNAQSEKRNGQEFKVRKVTVN